MRYVLGTLLITGMLTMAAIQSCSGNRYESIAGKTLAGEHQLRKMTNIVASESSSSFFLFSGSFSEKQSLKVTFAWKMNDGTYAISTLPIEKIRVKIDNNIAIPAIKFRWVKRDYREVQDIMDLSVIYAVVTCKDSDWPQNINLPLQ